MLLSEYKQVDNIPGIYIIKNNINNKCYIGQSIRLQKRIQTHYHNANSRDNDSARRMILYHAIKKYGIENFTVDILYSINTTEYNEVKQKLDILEKEYIQKYNSYVPNGYNQTVGGDAGVLGLKMTDEQKLKISKNVLAESTNGQYMCYCYDMVDNVYYTAVNTRCLNIILRINNALKPNQTDLNHSNCRRNVILKNRFIIGKTKDELQDKINKSKTIRRGSLMLNSDAISDIMSGMKQHEFCVKYNVCKKTYYNYRNYIKTNKI